MPQEKAHLSPGQIESRLAQFRGSDMWYRTHPNVLITDGVKFLADECKAYWLIDNIASYQIDPKVKNEGFQVIDLTVDEIRKGLIVVTDGNENELFRQTFFTTFPLKKMRLYYTGGVCLLPSEY